MKIKAGCVLLFLVVQILSVLHAQIPENFQTQIDYLNKYGKPPDQYVIDKSKTYDIILLGESHALKNNLDFVMQLIPELYKAGIYNLGMEFGASEDQQRLD